MRFNASLGSKTDTLLYNGDSLTLTVYSLIRDRDLVRKRLRLWEHIDFLSEGGKLWLDGCLGVEPRVANHVVYSKWALW
jgi:hypothetical protein